MRVKSSHVNKLLKVETSALHGHSSGSFRLEWITQTGGDLNVPHNELVGATDMINISADIPGIWGPVMRDQRERINVDGNMISIDQFGFVYFANDLNLQGKNNLVIYEHVKDPSYTGAGTGAAAIWTPDGHLTVTLASEPNGLALPTDSTSAAIMRLIEWHPVRRDLGLAAGALAPINEQMIFQSIFVSRIPIAGQ